MLLSVKVIAGAKKASVAKVTDEGYKVHVDEPAEKGKANSRLVELLAEHFNVSPNAVSIVKGLKSSRKLIEIKGLSA